MTTARERLDDRIIDEYLASWPDLHPAAGSATETDSPERYTADDRERILSWIFEDSRNRECETSLSAASERTRNLFGDDEFDEQHPSAVARPSSFFGHVIQAYLSVYEGFSIDRLIADRERNSLFISKCWSLGVQASARDLNWALLNARKANRVGPVPGVTRFTIPPSRMYEFLFASEIALRHVQDIEWTSKQRSVSLDLILCDPNMSEQFESLAKQLAPGFSIFEYRWAAMCIRKNQRRSVRSPSPRFQDLGPTSQIRASRLPTQMGFYWFQSGKKPLYVGHAENIQKQVDKLIQQGDSKRVFPDWMLADTPEPIRLAVATTNVTSLSKRETLKSEVCLSHSPLFNACATGTEPPLVDTAPDNRRCA